MIKIIADGIQDRLELIGLRIIRDCFDQLRFKTGDGHYFIWCTERSASLYSAISYCGEYLYADPDFHARLIRRVRMVVKPTPVWHITKRCPGLPRILDE